jgi:feruloyl esterase
MKVGGWIMFTCRRSRGVVVLATSLLPLSFGATCESLAGLSLPDTTIAKAETVAAGAFAPPNMPPAQQANFKRSPAFCRVAAEIKPTPDSDIKIEVWMPVENWNGKFMGVGNGGWSGAIVYPALGMALNHGYAAASTNTGHDGTDATFALGHPEKLIDFGYRAVHEMTLKGKAITEAFYSKAPARSYWNGCSSGGKQGLKEAQKFPMDYDGIVAGAPANYWTHLMTGDLWPAVVTHKDPAAALAQADLTVLHKAALQACDNLDGVKDGLIEDPTRCHFDPGTLLCKGSQTEGCLMAPQVEAARKIYAGATNPRTGKSIFPGMTPGSELVWPALAGQTPFGIPVSHFQYVVFKDPKWDYLTLNFDKDVELADKLDNGLLNATDPDLKAFFGHGGKLLMYHGWNDQLITPLNSVNYYNSVVRKMGGAAKVSNSYRLFMAPGMNHCGGGDGPARIDVFTAIDEWVSNGKAPEQMLAEHVAGNKVDRSRPLCPYPLVAKYKGSGSIDEAANFTCAAEK